MNIEQYKRRFFNLMESTIGDVRPLLTESLTDEKKNEYKGKWSVSNVLNNENSKTMYKDAIVNDVEITDAEDEQVVKYYNNMIGENKLNMLITMYDKMNPLGTSSTDIGSSPISSEEGSELSNRQTTNVDDLVSIIRKSDVDKYSDNFCKTESGYDICLVKKSMKRSTLDKMYNDDVRRIEAQGYKKIKESQLTQDTEGNYIRRSTWKKT